jgi:predicted Ser/Thr protein kinase
MARCPACGHELPDSAARCPACGAGSAADEATRPMKDRAAGGGGRDASTGGPVATTQPRSGERFAPGTLLLDRYRILGRIGAGGMGEVYRAEDLTLDQVVALKFISDGFGDHEDRRRRFLQEVRLARQVAHPNVCRVYDIGEAGGQLFLSMEFVEGRDLASVLRSIGRLPAEKALDIARQLCAGLQALHDRGVLHRDLKPANVMLDEDGRVRITDFGLAGVADQLRGAEVHSGTPQYMAPEQLAGQEVTVRSDIYSLGLVLYEVFSGKRTFEADSIERITEMHRTSVPSRLSSHVSDVDPAVERIVLRCLEKDPARRPPSALVVSTALPGGDPLAAALAMGDTPSPELVAASGGAGGLHPVVGLGLLVIALCGLFIQAGLKADPSLARRLPLDRSADALQERARQLITDVGYEDSPLDRERGFGRDSAMLAWLARQDSSRSRWISLSDARPWPLVFWYRQSPDYLLTNDGFAHVGLTDPPPLLAGMVSVILDAEGRLISFQAVPPETLAVGTAAGADTARTGGTAGAPSGSPSVDDRTWDRLFAAADLDRSDFAPTDPVWIPDVFVTERRAWRGRHLTAGHEVELTIEAGALGSRPVYFLLRGPWSAGHRTAGGRNAPGFLNVLLILFVIGVLAAGVALALRNHRRHRTDTQGAGRLAAVLLVMPVLRWAFSLHHVPLPDTLLNRFFEALAIGALYALFCLVLYLALEPYVRRTWPHVLIGWTRLMSGAWRDPMVGRSVLAGGAMFGLMAILSLMQASLRGAFGLPPPTPGNVDWWGLATPRGLVGSLAFQLPNSLFNTLFFLMLLVLMRLLLRRPWPAYLAFLLLAALILGLSISPWQLALLVAPLLALLWSVVLVRAGLLAFFVGFFLWQIGQLVPFTLDSSQMYIATSLLVMGSVALLLCLSLGVALGGRSLLRDDLESG